MTEVLKCNTCKFQANLNDWETSIRGRRYTRCVKCREYARLLWHRRPESRIKYLEDKASKYRTDEVFRNNILEKAANRKIVYIECEFCMKYMRYSSLRPHLIVCKREFSPALVMLKKLSDAL